MIAGDEFLIVLVTAPDIDVARRLTRGALEERLVACGNLLPGVESHYWWQGKIESGAEVLCVFKTTRKRVEAFEQFVLKNHPYDTPEIIALPITSGTQRYLEWIRSEAAPKA